MTALPPGFGVDLDPSLLIHGNTLVRDRAPFRIVRLTDAGRTALGDLSRGAAPTAAARRLAGRLVDAEMAHPRPCAEGGSTLTTTVVVPVRDRPQLLERCLAALGPDLPVIVVDDGSRDGEALMAVCDVYAARVVRRPLPGGPSAARNAGLDLADTDVVAFVDSDVEVSPGALQSLLRHFEDPAVAAVAPRVIPSSASVRSRTLARFLEACCPLDMGSRPGAVGVGRAVPYVPTATLLVRRSASPPFDELLTVGEDVDLVWRLTRSGWVVRYVPDATVLHREPTTWRGALARRFRYGSSVAPLSKRHPGHLPHLLVSPWTLAIVASSLSGRPRLAAVLVASRVALVTRRCRRAGAPTRTAIRWSALAALRGVLDVGRVARTFGLPVALACLSTRRARRPLLLLAVASAVVDGGRPRPRLDPLRGVACRVLDDVAYAAGVVYGCAEHRTIEPLMPVFRPAWDGAARQRAAAAERRPGAA